MALFLFEFLSIAVKQTDRAKETYGMVLRTVEAYVELLDKNSEQDGIENEESSWIRYEDCRRCVDKPRGRRWRNRRFGCVVSQRLCTEDGGRERVTPTRPYRDD